MNSCEVFESRKVAPLDALAALQSERYGGMRMIVENNDNNNNNSNNNGDDDEEQSIDASSARIVRPKKGNHSF
jgi:hypothetical protein